MDMIQFDKLNFGIVSKKAEFKQSEFSNFSNLKPLKCDSVSFGSMKKTQFSGIDLAVVEKFKAPIDKFKSKEDFDNWADGQINQILSKNYSGRDNVTCDQRKEALKMWKQYIQVENGRYTKAEQLLIFDAITKNLKPDNTALLPTLNKGVLASLIFDINNDLKTRNTEETKKYAHALNFGKLYTLKLKSFVLDEGSSGETDTKWIIIPSKTHDPKNFEKNVTKLQLLSCNSWCTKTNMAKPYLEDGDFHVFVDKGKTKVGVRFDGDKVDEIQGKANNSRIPMDYFDEVYKHLKEGKYKISKHAQDEIKFGIDNKETYEELKDAVKNNDSEGIFDILGFNVKKNAQGKLILSHYMQPFDNISVCDLGIDEDKLFENVVEIKGDADFSKSKLTSLHNIKKIGGDLIIGDSTISDIGALESIEGNADFRNTHIRNFKNLTTVGGDFKCSYDNYESLNGDETDLDAIKIDFGTLRTIGGDADFSFVNSDTPTYIESIGGDADFHSATMSLDCLKTIGGEALFSYAKILSMPNIEKIEDGADFTSCQIENYSPYIKKDFYTGEYITDEDDIYSEEVCKDEEEFMERLDKIEKNEIFDPDYIEPPLDTEEDNCY